jgi:hypothetical protein
MSDEREADLDVELAAFGAVGKALKNLPPESQGRILRWALDKFKVSGSAKLLPAKPSSGSKSTDDQEPPDRDFEDLPALFGAARAKLDKEKALVVGYWHQVIQGNKDFTGFDVNSELKQLGHGIGNITTAMDDLIEEKPQLVIQVQKAGTSKQARKKYRVTTSGIKAVERMLAAGDNDTDE